MYALYVAEEMLVGPEPACAYLSTFRDVSAKELLLLLLLENVEMRLFLVSEKLRLCAEGGLATFVRTGVRARVGVDEEMILQLCRAGEALCAVWAGMQWSRGSCRGSF